MNRGKDSQSFKDPSGSMDGLQNSHTKKVEILLNSTPIMVTNMNTSLSLAQYLPNWTIICSLLKNATRAQVNLLIVVCGQISS